MKLKLLLGMTLISSFSTQAAWWIEPTDLALRADIQLLSDTGIIIQPVTTYPLMWAGIKQDLESALGAPMSSSQKAAYDRIIEAYNEDHKAVALSVALNGANESARFIGFGNDYRDKAETKVNAAITKDWFSGRLSASYHYDAIDGNETRLDNSFAAVKFGNWILTGGAVQKYWGPGWDSSLLQTTNARPLPGVTLSRHNSKAFETPWLSWVGPWTFTTSFNQMESDRYVPDTKHWAARGTLRPISRLELGFSWAMQWGGEGYGNSLSDWWDGLTNGGKTEGEIENGQENMLAGYDVRWSDTAWGIPYGIYYERMHEDFHHEKNIPINSSNMGGVDVYISELSTRFFIEYSDTSASCGASSSVYNCMYEHSFYKSGYRYYGRSLGSTYDNDSRVVVIGGITQLDEQQTLTTKLRLGQLNFDGVDLPAPGGNPVSPGRYERLHQIDTSYHRPLFDGELKVGGTISYSQYPDVETDSEWDTVIYAGWERDF